MNLRSVQNSIHNLVVHPNGTNDQADVVAVKLPDGTIVEVNAVESGTMKDGRRAIILDTQP